MDKMLFCFQYFLKCCSRSGELRKHEIKVSSGENTELKGYPSGVGQYIAVHAALTARDFFLISTCPVHSPAFFSKTSPDFFPVSAVANTGCCVGPQDEIGHPAGCRFPC